MAFWIRDATLQVGGNQYHLETMNFDFEIPFEDNEQLATTIINVYNLSESTRNGIQEGHVVIINAGYEGDIGCIFIGRVAGLSHKQTKTEWVTRITATVALTEWLDEQVYKTYAQSTTAEDIVLDLLNIFGVEVGQFELKINKVYSRGKVCRGKVKDVLREIVVLDCKSRLMLRPTGQLIINKPETGVNMGFVLSEETGLLKATDEYEVIPIQTDITSQIHFNEREEEIFIRSSLLNYHIGPADIVMVRSRSLNGRFMVIRGRHLGSRAGKWRTEMELKAI